MTRRTEISLTPAEMSVLYYLLGRGMGGLVANHFGEALFCERDCNFVVDKVLAAGGEHLTYHYRKEFLATTVLEDLRKEGGNDAV